MHALHDLGPWLAASPLTWLLLTLLAYIAALALYRRMLPLVKMVGGHRYVSASKFALEYMGLPVGTPRSPRLPLPDADRVEMISMLDRLDLKNAIPHLC